MAWEFKVRGFAGGRHPRAPTAALLAEMVHSTETSAAIEIDAWKSRMERGEVSRAELIDMRPLGKLTNLHVYHHTHIPWSWCAKSLPQ